MQTLETSDGAVAVDLSLVIALYFEEECIDECIRRIREELDGREVGGRPLRYEVVFVDDGSQDRTVEKVAHHAADDSRLKLVVLSRNHGKPAAVTAGVAHARGRWILTMDPDLQDPPDRILDFYRTAEDGGFDLVLGLREDRRDPWTTRLFSRLFWSILNGLTGLRVPSNLAVMRLFSHRFGAELLRYRERVRFIEGLQMSIGMPRTTLRIEHRERFAGTSKFTFKRRIRLAVDAILAFSDRPLQLTTGCGLVFLALSLLYGVYLFVRKLVFGIGLLGWTSTMLAVLLMGSIQIILLGIIGSYVGRLYTESKARPVYTVMRRINLGAPPDERTRAVR
ncbi:MAG: glycosyltransferase family 2 protein [Acidobacteriota bacterium]